MVGPTQVVGPNCLFSMPAVDKNETERRGPGPGGNDRGTNQRDDERLETGLCDRAAKSRQRIDAAAMRIPQFGVEVFFAGLLLLRTAVMIDREERAAAFPTGRAEVEGRLRREWEHLLEREAQSGWE